jgi:hypothetical protein
MPPTGGPEGTLAVARWAGKAEILSGERSSTRMMPVAHLSAASACTMKSRARIRTGQSWAASDTAFRRKPPEAFADAVLHAGGRGT